jgi:hypothetical protein
MKRPSLILVLFILGLLCARLFCGVETDSVKSGGQTVVTVEQMNASNSWHGDCVQMSCPTNQYTGNKVWFTVILGNTNINNGGISLQPESTNNAIRVTQTGVYQAGFFCTANGSGITNLITYAMTNGLYAQVFSRLNEPASSPSGVGGSCLLAMQSGDYYQVKVYISANATPYLSGTNGNNDGITCYLMRLK